MHLFTVEGKETKDLGATIATPLQNFSIKLCEVIFLLKVISRKYSLVFT